MNKTSACTEVAEDSAFVGDRQDTEAPSSVTSPWVVPRSRTIPGRRRGKYGRKVQTGRCGRLRPERRNPPPRPSTTRKKSDVLAARDAPVKNHSAMLYFTPFSPYRGSVSHQALQAGSRSATSQTQDRAPVFPSATAQPRHAAGNLRTRSSLFSRGLSAEVFSFVDNAVRQFENQRHIGTASGLGLGAGAIGTTMALECPEEEQTEGKSNRSEQGSSVNTRKQPSRTPLSENHLAGTRHRTSTRIQQKRAQHVAAAGGDSPAAPSTAKAVAPIRPTRVPQASEAAKMKRERSAKSELAMKPAGKKVKQKAKHGDIQSPTSRTLLRMLRVGTGEATANNTSKEEAEKHIRRLAGKYTPTETLGRRYAGRQALQELLTTYLGRVITFQQAAQCFENPHNRGLQATPMLHELLGGKCWPPYPDNALSADSEASDEMDVQSSHSDGLDDQSTLNVLQASDGHVPGFRLPAPSGFSNERSPFGQTVTSGALVGSSCPSSQLDDDDVLDTAALVNEFRAVITTGFSKTGTAFQMESELESLSRHAGVHSAKLELKSFQLFTHCPSAPAALVTLRLPKASDGTPTPAARPMSLTSLRCSDIFNVPQTDMPLMTRSGSLLRDALLANNLS